MNFLLCFSATTTTILAVLVNFSLAAETAKLHQNDGNSTHHLEKGVQKASSYYCNSFSNCNSFLGVYSSCNSRGRCVCDMGYEERASSTHCQKVVCSSMTDCTGKFGLFSHCSLGSCHCDSGYSYDLELETCSRISTTIPSHYSCSSYSDCDRHLGTWSSCNSNGRCVCDMGYEEKATTGSSGSKCQRRSCSSTTDCMTKYGTNSHCSFGSCSCDYNYSYDLQLETCSRSSSYDYYYYHSGPNFGLIIGLPVTIIGLIIISVAIVMVRRRRQQELAAAAAARVVAMQRGAVVQQPATVVINHQQNPQHFQPPQHPQHPVYYQQQQNPPPFNPTFTGYQPQQAPPQYQPPVPAYGVYPSVSSGGQYPNPAQTHYKS